MSGAKIDPIIPKSLVDAVKHVFSVQASVPVEIERIQAVPPAQTNGIDIISTIGLKDTAIGGTMALCFPKKTFLSILNKMLGENHTEITPQNSDGAGELLNIIYATARVKINLAGHSFLPAIPTVIFGERFCISHGDVPLIVRLDCRCEFGTFHLEISLRKTA